MTHHILHMVLRDLPGKIIGQALGVMIVAYLGTAQWLEQLFDAACRLVKIND